MQQKFLMLLEEVIENKNKEDTLYGWGKNESGQLGSRNANFVFFLLILDQGATENQTSKLCQGVIICRFHLLWMVWNFHQNPER